MREFYEHSYTNVHRSVYRLAERATEGFEGARQKIAAFVNAPSERDIVFTRSSTEALNLVAYAWGLDNLGPGDVVVVTELEHHSNFVPWQYIAKRTGASFRHIPIDDQGELQLDALDGLRVRARSRSSRTTSSRTRSAPSIRSRSSRRGRTTRGRSWSSTRLRPHLTVRSTCRRSAATSSPFSSHKMCGPSGVGALWGRRELLEAMSPFNLGGEMIRSVSLEQDDLERAPVQVRGRYPRDR